MEILEMIGTYFNYLVADGKSEMGAFTTILGYVMIFVMTLILGLSSVWEDICLNVRRNFRRDQWIC